MTTEGTIAKVIPGLMGVSLLGYTYGNTRNVFKQAGLGDLNHYGSYKGNRNVLKYSKAHPKVDFWKGSSRPNYRKASGTLVKGAVNIMVGTALLGGVAGQVNSL